MLHFFYFIFLFLGIMTFSDESAAELFSEEANRNLDNSFKFKYFESEVKKLSGNSTFIGLGLGGHRRTGKAKSIGAYLSGITPIGDSKVGVYGRAELIRDHNNSTETRIWSWKGAIGLGYYFSEKLVPYINLAQCFPSEATCYYVPIGEDEGTERDTDSIYIGIGTFFEMPLIKQQFEISIDWTPYSTHHNRSIYIGYAFVFD